MRDAVTSLTRSSGVWAMGAAFLALVACGIQASGGATDGVTILLIAGVLGIHGVRHRRGLIHPGRRSNAVGSYVSARLLVIATIATHARELEGAQVTVTIACCIAAVGVLSEMLIRNVRGRAKPYAANIPNITPDRRFKYGPVFTINFTNLVILTVAEYWNPSIHYVSIILGSAAALYSAAILVNIFTRVAHRLSFESRISEIIDDIGPAFILLWEAAPRTAYQITMWLPYLERLNLPFIVVTRNTSSFSDAQKVTTRPVLLRASGQSLDAVVRPSVRGVFYVNNSARNVHMTRFHELTHIQLNHGESDKAPSFNPMFRIYDYDFVAGQAAIDRFAANGVWMPDHMFSIVGRPQVENITIPAERERLPKNPTVLYAPTWSGFNSDSNYSSMPIAPVVVKALLSHAATVIFRPHPYVYRDVGYRANCAEVMAMLRNDAALTGRNHVYGEQAERGLSLVECFNLADAMISDVSSVVGDFLFSEKPLAMISPHGDVEQFTTEFPMARAAYIIDANGLDVRNIDDTLNDMLELDSKRRERMELKSYYLGDIPAKGYADVFVNEALEKLGVPSSERVDSGDVS